MNPKIFFTFIFQIALFNSVNFAQKMDCSDVLLESLDKEFQQELLTSLDSLVGQIRRNQISEKILWQKESKLSKTIFEEVHSYEKSFKDSTHIISNSILNCYPIGKDRHLCQIAYYRQKESNSKSLQLLLSILVHKENGILTFSTPLNYYTDTWKKQKVGSIEYYYRDNIRIDRAEKFAQKNILFASRFKKPVQSLHYFMVENYQELLRLLGFDFNAKSIGKLRDGFGVLGDEVIFSIMNNEDFSHDLFHYYSETIHKWPVRNWVTEEGLAYSWGNAYYTRKDGEIAEQKELVEILQKYMDQNPNVDLLSLFENNIWTDRSGIYEHIAPDYQVGRLISSLICDEVDKKQGMEGINIILKIGSKPNHIEPFLQSIDDLLGINRSNFNERVYRLIENYR